MPGPAHEGAPIALSEWTHPGAPNKPDGAFPLYMQPATLADYGIPKEDDEVSFTWVDKAKMQQECQDKGAMCDWDPQKAQVAAHCQGEEFLIVFDEDEVFGENFYICSDAYAQEVMAAAEALRPPGGGGGDEVEGGDGAAEGSGEAAAQWVDPPVMKEDWTHPGAPNKPDGAFPLYMQPGTLEEYGIAKEDDEVSFTWVNTAKMQQECQDKGAMCDWDPVKGQVAEHCQGEEFLIVFDEDEVFGENFYICSDAYAQEVMAAREAYLAPKRPAAGGGGEGGEGGGSGGAGGEAVEGGEGEPEGEPVPLTKQQIKDQALATIELPPLVIKHPANEDGSAPSDILPMFLTPDCRKKFGISVALQADGVKPDETGVAYSQVSMEAAYADIQTNAKLSDWYECKGFIDTVAKEGAESFNVVYDGTESFGESFYLCGERQMSAYMLEVEAAKKEQEQQYKDLKSAKLLDLGLSETSEEEDPNAPPIVIPEIQPSAEGWETQGSADEVEALSVKDTRPLVRMSLQRKRRFFGGMAMFYDQNAADIDSVDIRKLSMPDPNYKLQRSLTDKVVQAVPDVEEAGAQTTFFVKQNAAIQYEAQTWSEEKREDAMFSTEMTEFLNVVRDRCELTLQQNEVVNLYEDPYKDGDDEGLDYAEKDDEDIAPSQNFPDRNKSVMCIEFQPGKKGVVGVAGREQFDLDVRVQNAGNVGRATNPARILVYDITEAMAVEPIVTLEAPDDIHAFRFNPSMPHIVVGGTKTGQVCMWNIQAAQPAEVKKEGSKKGDGNGPVAGARPVTFSLFSHIESSHSAAVSDIQWLTKGFRFHPEEKKKGKHEEVTNDQQWQFISASADGNLIIWDCSVLADPATKELSDSDPLSYDALWKPIWKTSLRSLSGSSPMAIERFRMTGEGLNWVASSQEGEVATGEGFPLTAAAKTITPRQQGAVMVVQESPFMPGVYLTVGDWTFHIWKEGVAEPLFSSPYSPRYLMTGAWSPTRPGLIMVARNDGVLQAWDLLGRNSASPSDSVTINNLALTTLAFGPSGAKGPSGQVLAVGDANGTLHILELPRNLWRMVPQEKALVEGMLEREVSRVSYVDTRRQIREAELTKKQAEAAKAEADAKAAANAAAPAAAGADDDAEEDPEAAKLAAEAAAKEAELVKLEAEYEKSELEFKIMLGLVEPEGED